MVWNNHILERRLVMSTFIILLALVAIIGMKSSNAICTIIGCIAFLFMIFFFKGIGILVVLSILAIVWFCFHA